MSSTVFAQGLDLGNSAASHRFAAGDILPITLQLTNFGYAKRVDVTISYTLTDVLDSVILEQSKTVAVETTASFTERIQLPGALPPGSYTLHAKIAYSGQEVPAISSYSFVVERAVLGFFVRDLLLYGALTVLAIIALVIVIIRKRVRLRTQYKPHDYAHIPRETRAYYEIIDAIIYQMRLHDGDAIFKQIASVTGLAVNEDNGMVKSIADDPAAITAELMKRFETKHNVHINLSFIKKVPAVMIRKRT